MFAPEVLMLIDVLVAVVALQHLFFLALEMFLWKKPFGRNVFRTTPEFAESTAALAANQGLYNGFLAAGLAWSLVAADPSMAHALKAFFLGCVVVAGIFGGITVSRGILVIQGVPAAIALALVLLGR